MKRLLVLAAGALLLGGCATDYGYRGGSDALEPERRNPDTGWGMSGPADFGGPTAVPGESFPSGSIRSEPGSVRTTP